MTVCEVCGNSWEATGNICPYCGSKNDDSSRISGKEFIHKIVNLEQGRPVVEVALSKMNEVLGDALRTGVTVVTLIHGYGSTGKGGAIRSECRKSLDYMKSKGTINTFIPGEEFNKKLGVVKLLLKRYPQLAGDKNLNRANRGITIVIVG